MSDLISRQALIEEMCRSCDMEACDGLGRDSTAKCYSVRLIEEAQTAYDVDKVCRRLDEAKDMDNQIDADHAIKIAREGGIDE